MNNLTDLAVDPDNYVSNLAMPGGGAPCYCGGVFLFQEGLKTAFTEFL